MSLNAALLEALRSDILTGAVAPGAKLTIQDLCERYSVTIGAVREALSRLVSEGLVDFQDQRGFRAARADPEALADICRVRVLIEVEALSDAIAHGDEEWEGRIIAALHLLGRTTRGDGDPASPTTQLWMRRHREFHAALVSGCRSPWLVRFHELLYVQTERYRLLSSQVNQEAALQPRDVGGEHRALADAVMARDAALACRLIREHIETTAERVLSAQALEG
jgi:DNA-binding GntR family transcriptional regulator